MGHGGARGAADVGDAVEGDLSRAAVELAPAHSSGRSARGRTARRMPWGRAAPSPRRRSARSGWGSRACRPPTRKVRTTRPLEKTTTCRVERWTTIRQLVTVGVAVRPRSSRCGCSAGRGGAPPASVGRGEPVRWADHRKDRPLAGDRPHLVELAGRPGAAARLGERLGVVVEHRPAAGVAGDRGRRSLHAAGAAAAAPATQRQPAARPPARRSSRRLSSSVRIVVAGRVSR